MKWEIIGKSVQGALHKRKESRCQDKILWEIFGSSAVLAIADGHGSERSPKSDIGASLAVSVANTVLKEFSNSISADTSLSISKRLSEYEIPRHIVEGWKKVVKENHMIGTKEKQSLQPISGGNVEEDFFVQYGSTLLAVLATDRFVYFFQLGDGDMLVVEEDGSVYSPIPKDEHLIFSETTSLCLPKAWEEVRTAFRVIESVAPTLILVSTDGYSNSFKNDEEFLQLGEDYLTLIKNENISYVDCNLEKWLSETSSQGSGDDITVGIIYHKSTQ